MSRELKKKSAVEVGSKRDSIGKIRVTPLYESVYLKPLRAEFEMNGKRRFWDFIKVHDSVAVLIYNVSRNVLVFVRQFRPAMYLAQIKTVYNEPVIDTQKHDLQMGYSIELCAGLVDKNFEIAEVAKEEVLEECGYDVPTSSLRKLFSSRNVGISGQQNTLFYVEVTDDQKTSEGGGLTEEGESIEVIEMTIREVQAYIASVDIRSPPTFMAGIQWFLNNIVSTKPCK